MSHMDHNAASANGAQLDLIWGAAEIAKVIGRTPRVVFNMLEAGVLPGARKVNGRWVIERRKLVAFFTDEVA